MTVRDRVRDDGHELAALPGGRVSAKALQAPTIERAVGRRLRNAVLALGATSLVLAAFGASSALAKPRDRDHDGMPDRWELKYHLKVKRNDANRDADHDGVDNRNEYREHTNPRKRDSDGDGIPDGREDYDHDGLSNAAEDQTGNDPADPDTDSDGVKDGKELTGRIVSFDGSVLTIRLARGKTVEGLVSDATEISCESEQEAENENELDDHSDKAEHVSGSAENSDDEHGDNDEERGDASAASDDESNDHCSADALKPETAVQEAEGEVGPDGLHFTSVKLVNG